MNKPNCLIVKTSSEIFLKSAQVQKFFLRKLREHISFALKQNKIEVNSITHARGRFFIYLDSPEKAQVILSKMFGVHATALAFSSQENSIEALQRLVLNVSPASLAGKKSFAVRVTRVSKKWITSRDVEMKIGSAVLSSFPALSVNLEEPDATIFIELHEKNFFVYFSEEKSLGGLPLGVEGSIAFLFEGREDELAAAYLLMKRGCNLFPVVKKESKILTSSIARLVPFNAFREFSISDFSDIPLLVSERKIKAIGFSHKEISEISSEKTGLLELYPLLFFPENLLSEIREVVL